MQAQDFSAKISRAIPQSRLSFGRSLFSGGIKSGRDVAHVAPDVEADKSRSAHFLTAERWGDETLRVLFLSSGRGRREPVRLHTTKERKVKDLTTERHENWRSWRRLRSSDAAVESPEESGRRGNQSATQVNPITAGSDLTSLPRVGCKPFYAA